MGCIWHMVRQLASTITLLLVCCLPAWGADNQLTFVFQKQKDPASIKLEADRVAEFLSEKLGQQVRTQVPSDYAASVQALVSKRADIAYIDSIAFLLARRDGGAKMLLAEQRLDSRGQLRTDYDSIFVVRQDSQLSDLAQVVGGAKNLRIAFTSPTSTSGYVMAYRRLVKEGLLQAGQNPKRAFKSVSFAGSYTAALEQVLADRADLCAVSYYALEGKGADKYLARKKRNKLRVLARTPGVPTHVVAARAGLEPKLVAEIRSALLALSDAQPHLLEDVYGTSRFVRVDEDQHVQASVEAIEYLQLPITGIVNKTLVAKNILTK